jgi:hypothetical protein
MERGFTVGLTRDCNRRPASIVNSAVFGASYVARRQPGVMRWPAPRLSTT